MRIPTPAPHDFKERLQWSESGGDEPFWDAVYRSAFPNLVSHMPTPGDHQSQRMGIDRSILLANGKTIYIDEKKRAREYSDILLEYVSVSTTGAPGWMEKDLAIDFLAYAFMQSKRCYLFSWPSLRRAWIHNRDEWKAIFGTITAQNKGYETLSVAVPIKVLQAALVESLVIDLPKPVEAVEIAPAVPIIATPRQGTKIHNLAEFQELWPFVLARMKKKIGPTAVSYLHASEPIAMDDQKATLGFRKEFHFEKAVEAAKRLPFEQVVNECLATPHSLIFSLYEPAPSDAIAARQDPRKETKRCKKLT